MISNRWGRFFAAAFNHPEHPALGLNANTAIEVGPDGASVTGDNTVVSLDLRQANLAVGENRGFVIANGLLDAFAPGEMLAFEPAISAEAAEHAPTPVLLTATATPQPTATATTDCYTDSYSHAHPPSNTYTSPDRYTTGDPAPLQPGHEPMDGRIQRFNRGSDPDWDDDQSPAIS